MAFDTIYACLRPDPYVIQGAKQIFASHANVSLVARIKPAPLATKPRIRPATVHFVYRVLVHTSIYLPVDLWVHVNHGSFFPTSRRRWR